MKKGSNPPPPEGIKRPDPPPNPPPANPPFGVPVCDHRPAKDGWAPGYYSCKCMQCGKWFMGDKRAVQCADCAYKEETLDEMY